ncbi:hypothetical protein BX616_011177 [Lobosporangium transversale]|nr:hypothetical protein BX616_011177 [Lobosporangium transversale]
MDWLRGVSRELLEPQSALKVAMMHLENARKAIGAPELEVALCLDAYNALLRIRTSDRKTLVSASSSSSGRPDQEELRKNIALTIKEIASKLHTLGRHEHSRNVKKYGRKWGPVPSEEPMFSNRDSSCSSHNNEPTYPPSPTIPATPFPSATPFSTISPATTLVTNRSFPSSFNSISKPMIKETPSAQLSTIQSPLPKYSDIFTMDVAISMKISSLPKADEHLTDIHQLVHCLSLLPSSPLKRGHHLSPEEEEWSLAISKNQEEQERLQNLASDVLEMFMKDKTKAEASVTEVVSLAPVLKKELFRTLLMELINGIDSNVMLHTNLLDGLAQLIQGAPPGHIDPDDLVKILNVLNKRLHQTHNQSSDFIYRLSVAVSRVLDAMANSHVKELDRVHLHEPLKAYMDQLKRSKDIYQVYHAAHAFQALLYIPDNETKAQATLRRTTTVIRGLFGMVSAVKSMNVNDFIDQLGNIQDGLPSIELLLDLSLSVYNSMTSSAEHSTSFMESLRVGFNFSRKATWYPALRGADVLLQTGELFQFKALVHNAPCRHDPAFQWGLCQRLGQIAADTKWDMDTRRDAIVFLGEIYKNDHHWKDYIPTKQWIVTILHKLSALSDNNLLG